MLGTLKHKIHSEMLVRFDQGERSFTQEDENVHACNPSKIETMYQARTEVPIQLTLQFSYSGSTSRTDKNKND